MERPEKVRKHSFKKNETDKKKKLFLRLDSRKNNKMIYCKAEIDKQKQRTNLWTRWERRFMADKAV